MHNAQKSSLEKDAQKLTGAALERLRHNQHIHCKQQNITYGSNTHAERASEGRDEFATLEE